MRLANACACHRCRVVQGPPAGCSVGGCSAKDAGDCVNLLL
jgi:hypothetical protein